MEGNLAMANSLEQNVNQILEGAYLLGFAPSGDVVSADQEIAEAVEFLTTQELLS